MNSQSLRDFKLSRCRDPHPWKPWKSHPTYQMIHNCQFINGIILGKLWKMVMNHLWFVGFDHPKWIPFVGISSLDFGGISGWIMMDTCDIVFPLKWYVMWEVTATFCHCFLWFSLDGTRDSLFFQLPPSNHPMAGFDDLIRKDLSLVAIVPWCSSPKQLFYGSIMEQSQKHTPYVTSAASCVVISVCVMRLVRGVFSSSWTVAKCISQVAFCIGWNVAKTTTWWLRIGGCSFWGAFIEVNESCKSKLCKRLA